ncbi:mRNA splicing protein PRP18 [Ascoidea rubescens DSM 1968]|uniref:Pre-mRNA-splicing factor 18 n=1 Tax=Ascoidea rubescens DSM 1968 TaxID=1344418 RepID=A0A1D2VAU9_9ASCO|nr:Prp18-domain-containing protein [Ascoidea rubescens DSM 1968]ODV58731.1 Prp18-domain-containing protein [Ascoidea rubescens DSM 1968]
MVEDNSKEDRSVCLTKLDYKSLQKDEINSMLKKYNEPVQKTDEDDLDVLIRLLKAEKTHKRQERITRYLLKEGSIYSSINFKLNINDVSREDCIDKIYIQMRRYIIFLVKQWDMKIEENLSDLVRKTNNESDNLTIEKVEEEKKMVVETKRNLVPLLVQLRKKTLKNNNELIPSLFSVLYYLQQRNYKLSNDYYLKLSIGNVAWPIGVIQVGIHARSAQGKITGEKQIANIMSDEKTRKWITSIKRLITFAEKRFPTEERP